MHTLFPTGCSFLRLLLVALSAISSPSAGPHSLCLCFSSSSLHAELPCLCLKVISFGFASRGFPSGQVSCLLLLNPFHLLILSFPELLVFCVVGVLPCVSCKYARMIRFSVEVNLENEILLCWGWEHFFIAGHPVRVDLHSPPCQPLLKPQPGLSCSVTLTWLPCRGAL